MKQALLSEFSFAGLILVWAAMQDKDIRTTLETVAPGVRGQVVGSQTLTPVDIEARYGTTHGHIHHGEQFFLGVESAWGSAAPA